MWSSFWGPLYPTEQATYEAIRAAVQRCPYHIVHYAGHGTYEKQSSEKSYLSLWEQEGKKGTITLFLYK